MRIEILVLQQTATRYYGTACGFKWNDHFSRELIVNQTAVFNLAQVKGRRPGDLWKLQKPQTSQQFDSEFSFKSSL
jgi:hypothetical protein